MITASDKDSRATVGQPGDWDNRNTAPYVRRPLIPVVLMYGTGVLAASLLPFTPVFLLLAILLLLATTGLALWTKRHALATILILFGFLLFGALRYIHVVHPQGPFHLSKVSNAQLKEQVEVEGTIVSSPETILPGGGWRRESRVRFLTRVQALTLDGVRYSTTGGARLSIVGPVQD